MVKFYLATDGIGNIVNIKDIEENARGGPYYCFGCDNEVVSVIGEIKTRHFRHKDKNFECSEETALHNMAKEVFHATYHQCLNNNAAYILTIQQKSRCNYFIDKLGNACPEKLWDFPYDLTEHYDICEIEKGINGFVADVLLTDSSHAYPPILIEMHVTHPCEQQKIDSGLKVIEIKIDDYSDVMLLSNPYLSFNKSKLKTFNFKAARDAGHCKGNCAEQRYVISQANDSTIRLNYLEMSSCADFETKNRIISVFQSDPSDKELRDTFAKTVWTAGYENNGEKSCLTCVWGRRHYEVNRMRINPDAVFCHKSINQKVVNHDRALECIYHNQHKTYELREARDVNEYHGFQEFKRSQYNKMSSGQKGLLRLSESLLVNARNKFDY